MLIFSVLLFIPFSFVKKDINYNPEKRQMPVSIAANPSTTGVNYYVDPASTSSTQDGSISAPWKTIAQVSDNMDRFNPGDNINFKRGRRFKGSLVIYRSGTASAPITFAAYGSGEAPVWQYNIAAAGTTPVTKRAIIYAAAGTSYITIDGIKFTDTTMTASTIHTATTANVAYALDFDGSDSKGCNGITLKNLDISLVGIGIEIRGNNNTVSNCNIYDLGGVVNVAGAAGFNNFGANGVVMGGSNNTIDHNYFRNLWRTDLYWGYDGGTVEMFGAVEGKTSNNKITYNTSINCNGFMEMGSTTNTDVADNNVFAYNLLINNAGRILTIHNGGDGFSEHVSNLQLFNNNVIETVTQYEAYPNIIWSSSASANKLVVMKNNIFWVTTNVSVTKSGYFSANQLTHTNNIYHLNGGSLNFTLGDTELHLGSSTAVFSNTKNADPALWDYTLIPGSPAINFSTSVGFTKDFRGNAVSGTPDAGIMEVTANTPPTVSMTKPLNNAKITAPASIDMSAVANDANGAISKVEFYNGTILLGTENYTPYTYTWENVPVGNYKLAAKAYDNMGLITTSASVSVSVVKQNGVTVAISNPLNNAKITGPASIDMSATANNANGAISKVEFYNGATLLRTENYAPYNYTWDNVPLGNYKLTAKAYDNTGLITTSASVSVSVVKQSGVTVSITNPLNNTKIKGPATIDMSAIANVATGAISKVVFYNGTTLLHTENYVPYIYSWNNVPVGNYTLTAKAYDGSGNITTSGDVSISVIKSTPAIGNAAFNSMTNTLYDTATGNFGNDTGPVNIKVAPNPASDKLSVFTTGLTKDKLQKISVLSISGVVLKSIITSASNRVVELDISSLINGLYFLQVSSGDIVVTRQFVKRK